MKTVMHSLAALLFLVVTSAAAEPYIFAGGGPGKIKAAGIESDSSTPVSIGAGFRLNSSLALEATYTDYHDMNSSERSGNISTLRDWNGTGLGLSVLGSWPLSASTAIVGKLGAVRVRSNSSENVFTIDPVTNIGTPVSSAQTSSSNVLPTFGVGVQLQAQKNVSLRAMLEQVNGKDEIDRIRLLSVSVIFSF